MEQQLEPGLTTSDETGSPPYASYVTFQALLERLRTEGIPLRFDRSVWESKYKASTGAQLAASLRFLGLLDGDKPQVDLEELVQSTGDERKRLLSEMLKRSYAQIQFDHLSRATPGMIEDWFQGYGLDGSTKRKAKAFFVNACKDADIPLSASIKKMARNKPPRNSGVGSVKNRRRARVVVRNAEVKDVPSVPAKPDRIEDGRQQMSQVELISGGSVTLSIDVDLFRLSKEDREFVLSLVDSMRSYSQDK